MVARTIWPQQVWQSGTNENSLPANDNSLSLQAAVDSAIDFADSEPGGPGEDDQHIVGTTWGGFASGNIVIYKGGTWLEFAAFEGQLKTIDGDVYKFDGADWNEVAAGAGGNRFVNIAMSDMTTDLTTGTAKAVWFAPEDGELATVYIAVHDPSSSGVVRVDMNDSGGTVFTTRPAIDATEATSLTGTDAVLDGTVAFSRGDKFTFDIDDAGTDAKGLQVCVEYTPA